MTLSNDPTAPEFDLAASMAEADRLLREAGWRAHIKPVWRGRFATPNMVGGIMPNGDEHVKIFAAFPQSAAADFGLDPADYPDTPHEAAAWLVRKFTNAPVFAVAEAPQQEDDSRVPVDPDYVFPFENPPESTDETPELPESQAAGEGDAPASGAVDSGDEGAGEGAPGSVADATSGTAIQRGQVHDEPGFEGADRGDGNYATDADYEEIGDEPEVIEDDSLDLGALEDHTPTPDVTAGAPDMPSGGVVYFGDDIHVARLAKIGALAEIARAKKAVLQEGWTVSEFASLQNLLVRIERKESPDDANARARFSFIEGRSRAMSAIDAYQNAREDELEAHGALLKSEDPYDREMARLAIAAFNPEAGWP